MLSTQILKENWHQNPLGGDFIEKPHIDHIILSN